MFEPGALWGFIAVVTVIVLLPGPNTALILGHSLAGGRRAGIATVLGVELGTVVHTLAAALGFSAILATSPVAFDTLRLAGAGVLVALGMRELVRGDSADDAPDRLRAKSAMSRAFLSNALNPKGALFFLAFVPQWVDASRGAPVLQFVVLGGIVSAIGWVVGVGIVLAASAMGSRLARHASFQRWRRRLIGTILVGVGLKLAFISSP